ncbi:MAG: HD domain-containing protein [Patescibacteria group bacterium]|nr:HD domain-containing protein [Patescibacteria group bacterium]
MNEKQIKPDNDIKAMYNRRRFDIAESNLRKMPELLEEKEDYNVYQGLKPKDYADYVEKIHSIEAREAFEMVLEVATAIKEAGGKALIVGGAVRDEVLGITAKDFDIEVYGLDAEEVERIAHEFGSVKDVGKAFGILKLQHKGGVELDISMPRTDSKIGEGHRGFEVKVDPNMSIADAARRRDFTFNALSKDPLTGEIFDPFHGMDDLREHVLRVTDEERFRDDPLRLLRGAQFVGRFGLKAAPETIEIFRSMVPEMAEISKERVREEWEKLLLKSKRPSKGLNLLREIGVVEAYYPELQALIGCEQEFEWHPEGDVWTHTLMVTDSARELINIYKLKQDKARIVILAALCHDLGKPSTTEFVDGRIRSRGHEQAGMEPAEKFLTKIGGRKDDIEKVAKIVGEHLWPKVSYDHGSVSDGAFRRLAKRLHPATIEELSYVSEADSLGTGPFIDPENPEQFLLAGLERGGTKAAAWVREKAKTIGVDQKKPELAVTGKELIKLGFVPSAKEGQRFNDVIRLADECRDLGGMKKEELLAILKDSGGSVVMATEALDYYLQKYTNPFDTETT